MRVRLEFLDILKKCCSFIDDPKISSVTNWIHVHGIRNLGNEAKKLGLNPRMGAYFCIKASIDILKSDNRLDEIPEVTDHSHALTNKEALGQLEAHVVSQYYLNKNEHESDWEWYVDLKNNPYKS